MVRMWLCVGLADELVFLRNHSSITCAHYSETNSSKSAGLMTPRPAFFNYIVTPKAIIRQPVLHHLHGLPLTATVWHALSEAKNVARLSKRHPRPSSGNISAQPHAWRAWRFWCGVGHSANGQFRRRRGPVAWRRLSANRSTRRSASPRLHTTRQGWYR
ncbi:MAG: hypothetical protein KatS3mg105_1263 [Gemmatales bacterium]|nr:MAG: hypothetical protein KatS3mg105_1263 [Gemmatales bacterium]